MRTSIEPGEYQLTLGKTHEWGLRSGTNTVLPSSRSFAIVPSMAISRRQWLADSALLGPLATHLQPSSSRGQLCNPSIAKVLLRHTVNAVNAMSQMQTRSRDRWSSGGPAEDTHLAESAVSRLLDGYQGHIRPLLQDQGRPIPS